MKNYSPNRKNRKLAFASSILLLFSLFGNLSQSFAHGGEDHGDEKPKTTSAEKGTISHTSKLGSYEIMLKHPLFEPDTATSARFFVTKFETNEPAENANPTIEIESENGAVTQAEIEKTEMVGSYLVKIPALPEGVYTVRAKLSYGGETDTATFSGVEIKPQTTVAAESEMSWARSALITFIFALVLAMFGALIFFVWRFAEGEVVNKETVSA